MLIEWCTLADRQAVVTGLTPTINGMMVIGLVSIPGMMTGQILGGSTPVTASRYQQIIMFLILSNTFWGTLAAVALALRSAVFDMPAQRLRQGRILQRTTAGGKDPAARVGAWLAAKLCARCEKPAARKEGGDADADAEAGRTTAPAAHAETPAGLQSPLAPGTAVQPFAFHHVRMPPGTPPNACALLSVRGAGRGLATTPGATHTSQGPTFAGVDLDVRRGVVVTGHASRAVQLHPNGGQFDFVWLPARTMHPLGAYVW